MFGLVKLVLKIGCLVLFFYGISQLEVNNMKVSQIVQIKLLDLLEKHGDTIENKVSSATRKTRT